MAVAAAAVARLDSSDDTTPEAFIEAGTLMVAVMITLAAATLTVTSDSSATPAAAAIFCCKWDVSVKSSTLPLAVSVRTTVCVDGGEGGEGGEGGSAGEH